MGVATTIVRTSAKKGNHLLWFGLTRATVGEKRCPRYALEGKGVLLTDMTTNTREEIRLGQLAVRFLVEGKDSGGSIAIFELDVPAGARVPIAHSHDAYEETI